MIERYKQELKKLKEKMEKAEKFAKKLPIFEKQILDEKITGEEEYINFGKRYKDLYLSWNINRGHYKTGTYRTIINFEGEYDAKLFNIYFNCCDLYNSHEKYGLNEIQNKVKVFFYDEINSTYYIEDEYIEEFLNLANDWYLQAREKENENRKLKEIKELEQKLNKLKEENK